MGVEGGGKGGGGAGQELTEEEEKAGMEGRGRAGERMRMWQGRMGAGAHAKHRNPIAVFPERRDAWAMLWTPADVSSV